MFSLYSVRLLQLVRLLAQALVEAAVHEGGGGLAGQGLQQVDLLAVERVEAVLAAHAQDRDQLALDAAGEVVGEVQRARLRAAARASASALTGSPRGQPAAAAARPRAGARPPAAAGSPRELEDGEGAVLLGQEDGQGLARPAPRRTPSSSRSVDAAEVEVGVQVLGEPQQRPARVVALAEEQPVDALLDAALHAA